MVAAPDYTQRGVLVLVFVLIFGWNQIKAKTMPKTCASMPKYLYWIERPNRKQ